MRFQPVFAAVLVLSAGLIGLGYLLAQGRSSGVPSPISSLSSDAGNSREGQATGAAKRLLLWEDESLSDVDRSEGPLFARLLFKPPQGGDAQRGPFLSPLPRSRPESSTPPELRPLPTLNPEDATDEPLRLAPESLPERREVPDYHIVEPGDTLWAIGLRYNTPWPTLAEINALPNPALIFPGQIIRLVGDAADAGEIRPARREEETYTVQAGDTLSGIGEQFGISWSVLARWNAIPNPNMIYVGQRLTLVGPPVAPLRASAYTASAPVRGTLSESEPITLGLSPGPVAYTAPSGVALQSGIATWYGPGFEGNRTACGHVFSAGELTAASNSLPCGSVVTVTNQITGASVTVRITDRGGFSHIMDLSYAAFSAIANPSAGVVPIVISSVP